MTEAKWNSVHFPIPLFTALQDNRLLTDRKARLFVVECCRWFWEAMTEQQARESVLVAEQFADRLSNTIELKIANQNALEAFENNPTNLALQIAYFSSEREVSLKSAAPVAFDLLTLSPEFERDLRTIEQANRRLADLIREIFPYTNYPFDESWRTNAVMDLATTIYDTRQYDTMPILADVLEDSGCRDLALLDHCRNPESQHVRGCWAIDCVLGKN